MSAQLLDGQAVFEKTDWEIRDRLRDIERILRQVPDSHPLIGRQPLDLRRLHGQHGMAAGLIPFELGNEARQGWRFAEPNANSGQLRQSEWLTAWAGFWLLLAFVLPGAVLWTGYVLPGVDPATWRPAMLLVGAGLVALSAVCGIAGLIQALRGRIRNLDFELQRLRSLDDSNGRPRRFGGPSARVALDGPVPDADRTPW